MRTLIQPFHSLSRILHDSDAIMLSNQYTNAHDLLSPRWQEDGNSFIVKVPVPGMSKEDLGIHLEGRILVISSTKSETSKDSVKNSRHSGFKHFITLPDGIDSNSIQATCKHGLLTITIDKKLRTNKHTLIKVLGPDDRRETGRLDSLWDKIKGKMNVRTL